MKVFLDANIIVSVLNKEYPLFHHTSKVISVADFGKKFELFTSPVCLAIAFYFAEKKSGTELAKKKIEILTTKVNVADTDREAVLKSLRNKKVHDFEDGLEYYSALNSKCKCIVTEDTGDFYFSEIDVLNAEDFLMKFVG